MECARCGTTNRDGARFCVGCGDPLQPRCSACDAELPFGARFCDACGAPVGVSRPTPDEAASRRTVTILFSDLTGSTALGERMDPESVRALMAPIYAAMRSEVETRGGHVSKFVGDGVMAVFGVPEVREDDAMRALDAAVGMQQALDRLAADIAREHGAILQLKVGVNTGEIVVGAGDEDIVGDCVNVAARLEGAAAPGEILVGEDTWRLTRAMATYEPVAPLTLKGKSGPVPAYRLVSLEQTTEARIATFVGRDAELARLLDVFDETVAASASRLVSIVGSPGLGKTRLARELGAALDERALVLETRCDPGGSATFAPVAEALRTAAAIAETAKPEEVTAAIGALVPDEADRDRIVARAAALLGTGEPGSTEETFWAIRRIVEVAARATPLVLVMDDLHWGEPLLLDLVEHLAEWNRSAPVLLVVTGRPELRQIRPALTEGGRASAVISLEGLDGEATGALACGLLGTDNVPAELLARLPESTEGNPLFVREFVRMLVDEGVLRRSNGAWTITVDVDAIQVPPTIQSLLSARVDRLDPAERTVLELASVVGKEFYRGAVHHLAPAAVRVSLDAHLESLRRKEFVEPAGTYWIDEPVFRFHHVLIRDAAYRRLLKEARADLHARVASWLEAKTEGVLGEHDELIGYHYEQAHESLRQLRSPGAGRDEHAQELERQAARHLSAAARSALDRDDIPAAAALSRRALERLDFDNPDRAQILIVHCEALLAVGDLDAADDPIQELEHLAEVASDERLKAWATCFEYEWRSLVVPSRLPELEERIGVAIEDLRSAGDQAGVAKAYTVHATVLASLGRVTECEVALDAALTAAREAGDRRRITDVLGRAMTAALWGPSPVARAGGRCLDLVRLSRITTNPPEIEATSQRCQAVLEAFRGRADAARRMLGSARRSLEELGRRQGLLQNELFAGIVELTDRDAAAAEPHLRSAYEGLRAMGVRAHAARAAALLARALLALGREDEADALARESEQLAGADLKAAIAWRGVRAEILARRGSHDEARRLAQDAVDMASRTEALVDHGDACMALAAVCHAAGHEESARRASEQAMALYERKGAMALHDARPAQPPSVPGAEEPAGPSLENECTRVTLAFRDRFERREDAYDLVAEDLVTDDRRRGIRAQTVGPQRSSSVGVRRIGVTVVATRGDRLALFRMSFRGASDDADAFRTDALLVHELNPQGRLAHRVVFDPEDLDSAVDELDELFLAGEGAAFAGTYRVSMAITQARNARDWETYRQVIAEDAVLVDHRGASLGELHGADAMISASRQLDELLGDTKAIVASVVAIRDGASVSQVLYRGSGDEGGEVEIGYCSVLFVEDGRIVRQERFPPDRLDLALARFEELGPSRDKGHALENAAVRVRRQVLRAFEQRRWDELEELFADDSAYDDRPHGLGWPVAGRAERVQQFRIAAELGVERAEAETIAVRGERLCLTRTTWIGPRGLEDVGLSIGEIDAVGRLAASVVFGPDDLDAAIAELDTRFFAGEGAHLAKHLQLGWDGFRAMNQGDWDRFRETVTEDCVIVDHRSASLGEVRGVDRFVEVAQELRRLAPDLTTYAASVPRLSEEGGVFQVVSKGRTPEGSDVELDYCAVAIFTDGRLSRQERFTPDRLDLALERFEQLHRPDAIAAPVENLCARVAMSGIPAWEAENWEAASAVVHEHVVFTDRRPGLGSVVRGRDAFIDMLRIVQGVKIVGLDVALVATRGERLALLRLLVRQGDPAAPLETAFLTLCEADPEGLIVAYTNYDEDALEPALAELDERSRRLQEPSTLGAGRWNRCVEVYAAWRSAFLQRDWERLADLFSDGLAFDDRRAGLQMRQVGRDAFIEQNRIIADLGIDEVDFTPLALRGERLALFRTTYAATVGESTFESCVLELLETDAGGVACRNVFFDENDLDAAMAELDARYAALRSDDGGRIANLATLALDLAARAFAARDWDALGAFFAEDCLGVDLRQGLRAEVAGRAGVLENMRAAASVGADSYAHIPVAVRGERLALSRLVYGTFQRDDAFEVEIVQVTEVGGDGRITGFVVFDADDLDSALVELDERFVSDERRPHAGRIRFARRALHAMNSRDWDAYRTALKDDLVELDHRPLSLGEIRGADAHVRTVKELVGLVPGARFFIAAIHGLEPSLALVRLSATGHTVDGDDLDLSFLGLYAFDGDLISHIELFPLEDLDKARARFEELRARDASLLANAATHASIRIARAFRDRDWKAFRAWLSDAHVHDDRRRGLAGRAVGGDRTTEVFELMSESLGLIEMRVEVVATRGERLGLVHGVVLDTRGNEIDLLLLNELDESGVIARTVYFDATDSDAAFDELEERYLAGEGSSGAEAIDAYRRFSRTYNARDWKAFRDLLADDFVAVDRRRLSTLGTLDAAAYVRAVQELIELIPGRRHDVSAVLALTPTAAVIRLVADGRTADGALIEETFYSVLVAREGRLERCEYYGDDSREAAMHRFEELRANVLVPDNEAARVVRTGMACVIGRDWGALQRLFTEEAVVRDTRAGLGITLSGVDAILENFRAVAQIGVDRMEYTVLATRGERLVIGRERIGSADPSVPYETELVSMHELDDKGHVTTQVLFDPGDLDAVFAELDDRYLAGEGSDHADVVRLLIDLLTAHAERDWTRLASLVAEGFVLVDRRPASLGRVEGREAWLDSHLAFVELVPDVKMRATSVSLGGSAVLCRVELTGKNPEGGSVEQVMYQVGEVRGGQVASIEIFPLDRYDSALARFEELEREGRNALVENAAARSSRLFVERYNSRDWSAIADGYSDEIVFEDRRTGMQARVVGREGNMEQLKAMAEMATYQRPPSLLATRGDRLALEHVRWDVEGFEVEHLMVLELDEPDRVSATVMFDPDDLDGAFDELDERYLVAEGGPFRGIVRAVAAVRVARSAGDFEAFRRALTSDFVVVDHRPTSFGSRTGDEWIESWKVMDELATVRWDMSSIFAIEPEAAVAYLAVRGQTPEGGEVEFDNISIFTSRAGVLSHSEIFGPEQLVDALSRFEELVAKEPRAASSSP